MTLTTVASNFRSSWWFEIGPCRQTPGGPPPSLTQLHTRFCCSFLTTPPCALRHTDVGAPHVPWALYHHAAEQVRKFLMLLVCHAQARLRVDHLDAHRAHQALDTFAVHLVPLRAKPLHHTA